MIRNIPADDARDAAQHRRKGDDGSQQSEHGADDGIGESLSRAIKHMRQVGALSQARVVRRVAQDKAAAHADAMKAGQQTQHQNEAIAHVLADVGRPALADQFGIEKNDEKDTGDAKDDSRRAS